MGGCLGNVQPIVTGVNFFQPALEIWGRWGSESPIVVPIFIFQRHTFFIHPPKVLPSRRDGIEVVSIVLPRTYGGVMGGYRRESSVKIKQTIGILLPQLPQKVTASC